MLEAKRHVIYNNGPELISMFVDVLKMSGRMNLRTF